MLYIVATPIGNLLDITLRALEVLRSCDAILCEDTRHSQILLAHYNISTKCYSYHNWNEEQRVQSILSFLQEGKKIALITDAGTPLISDPGYILVKKCYEKNIQVTALPGASAPLVALVLSGFSPVPFQFLGFFERKASDIEKQFEMICTFKGTSVCFESPKRVSQTLEMFAHYAPNTRVACVRELTKQHEQVLVGTAAELVQQVENIKGEIILVFEETFHTVQSVDPRVVVDFINLLIEHEQLSKKEAIVKASTILHIPRNVLYDTLLGKH